MGFYPLMSVETYCGCSSDLRLTDYIIHTKELQFDLNIEKTTVKWFIEALVQSKNQLIKIWLGLDNNPFDK